jgi:glycosyltransferase involved in cell wall biosynthesis
MIRPRSVHQFHSGAATGDAITASMLDIQRHLREMGYSSEIYAQYIGDNIADRVQHFKNLRAEPNSLLLFHHSMGHPAFEAVTNLDIPIVPVFHNITPPEFLADQFSRQQSRLGHEQLRQLAKRSTIGIAVSNYNRRQMLESGFRNVRVLPVRTDYSELRTPTTTRRVDHRWLFVGRVAANKQQIEVLREFHVYRRSFAPGATLHFVGDNAMSEYVDALIAEIDGLDLSRAVTVTGKVSDSTLRTEYAQASVFVCLSKHEGFGVPLLEAMATGVPVIALDRSAVAETMGGAGVLLRNLEPGLAASAAHVVASDQELRKRLVAHQLQRVDRLEGFDVKGCLAEVIDAACSGERRRTIQVQGPFETSYSLATLNRDLAIGLSTFPDVAVSIRAMDGPGDYVPSPANLDQVPAAAKLYRDRIRFEFPDVAIRQTYPPRVRDSLGGLRFQYFGWEESLLPAEVVSEFNANLDGIGVMSTFVKEVLERSGVGVPIEVVGVKVSPPIPGSTVLPVPSLRRCRFLHISSAFPRKGVDVLLSAFFNTFTSNDDVTLILKTFPNPHNDVGAILKRLADRHPNPPHVEWIDRDLAPDDLGSLYQWANCYVHVARGEGFGLPVAEAMLARVPVISVASTGLGDFVSDSTAAVIGHEMTAANTHLSVLGSEWAEPNQQELEAALRSAYLGLDEAKRQSRINEAESVVSVKFGGDAVATRWKTFIERVANSRRPSKVAFVSTYNSRCGIAEYTASLVGALGTRVIAEVFADAGSDPVSSQNEEAVERNWNQDLTAKIDPLIKALDASDADVVHVQFNFGFFRLQELARLIIRQSSKRSVVVTLHRTEDLHSGALKISLTEIVDALASASALIVHQAVDRDRLTALGLQNVELIPIGTDRRNPDAIPQTRDDWDIPDDAFVIGSFGFLLPHKGTLELIRSIDVLRKRHIDAFGLFVCSLHPNAVSAKYLAECEAEIKRLNLQEHVRLVTDYLPGDLALETLRCADVLCLPYEPTSESSSAALRFLLPVGRPIVTTDIGIFRDAADALVTVPSPATPSAISDAIERFTTDMSMREEYVSRLARYAQTTSWDLVAHKTYNLYRRLLSEHTQSGEHTRSGERKRA